ncbi:hypothetical protein [Vibrio splendidus]|uniref:hypothetical protein n=1 Tax=Vibrio splendidus TaxID=29497 RepID=UPI0011B71EA8|nr:hypothetical protein [Vibrio splendidus]
MAFLQQLFSSNTLVAVVTSLFASALFWKYLRSREKRIAAQIDGIEYQRELLDGISKGYQNLIRYAFRRFAIGLCVVCVAIGMLLIVHSLPFNLTPSFYKCIYAISGVSLIASAVTFYEVYKNILSLNNLDEVNDQLNDKKEKFKNKM